jgi:hypothetical protein
MAWMASLTVRQLDDKLEEAAPRLRAARQTRPLDGGRGARHPARRRTETGREQASVPPFMSRPRALPAPDLNALQTRRAVTADDRAHSAHHRRRHCRV